MTFDPDHGAAPTPAPSWGRRAWGRVRAFRPFAAKAAGQTSGSGGRRTVWSWAWRAAVVLVILYYPVGALVTEDIDDDPQFAPRNVTPGESRAVAIAADLVDR